MYKDRNEINWEKILRLLTHTDSFEIFGQRNKTRCSQQTCEMLLLFAILLWDLKTLTIQVIIIILQNKFSQLICAFFPSISKAKHSLLPPRILFPKDKDVIEVELGKYRL